MSNTNVSDVNTVELNMLEKDQEESSKPEINTHERLEKKKRNHEAMLIDRMRSKAIIEKNAFVLNMTNDLSTRQLKVVYMYLSNIDFSKKDHKPIKLDISTVLKTLGLTTGGANRNALKKELGELRQKTCWVNTITDEGKRAESAVGIADRIDITASDCTITFSKFLYEQLGYDGGNFATPILETIIALDSKHIINLYRWLKAGSYKGVLEIEVDDLRRITECSDKYSNVREFTRIVVKAGVDMINSFGDIAVEYKINRLNRKTHSYEFYVEEKTSFERYVASTAAKGKIDGRLIEPEVS